MKRAAYAPTMNVKLPDVKLGKPQAGPVDLRGMKIPPDHGASFVRPQAGGLGALFRGVTGVGGGQAPAAPVPGAAAAGAPTAQVPPAATIPRTPAAAPRTPAAAPDVVSHPENRMPDWNPQPDVKPQAGGLGSLFRGVTGIGGGQAPAAPGASLPQNRLPDWNPQPDVKPQAGGLGSLFRGVTGIGGGGAPQPAPGAPLPQGVFPTAPSPGPTVVPPAGPPAVTTPAPDVVSQPENRMPDWDPTPTVQSVPGGLGALARGAASGAAIANPLEQAATTLPAAGEGAIQAMQKQDPQRLLRYARGTQSALNAVGNNAAVKQNAPGVSQFALEKATAIGGRIDKALAEGANPQTVIGGLVSHFTSLPAESQLMMLMGLGMLAGGGFSGSGGLAAGGGFMMLLPYLLPMLAKAYQSATGLGGGPTGPAATAAANQA